MSNNYVCVKNGESVKRVLRRDAEKLVESGWAYCPRSLWREKVRDVAGSVAPAPKVVTPKPKNPANKAKNLKGKARKVAEKAESPTA